MQFAVCVSPVHQTAVSFRSLASLDSGDFSAVPAELWVDSDPDSSVTSFLESAVEELSVCSSTAGGFPWSKDSWRNSGSSSWSLVKRPRWSSTLQPWALVSRSSNPNTHTIKKMPPLYNIKHLSIINISTWPGKLMVSSSLITKKHFNCVWSFSRVTQNSYFH